METLRPTYRLLIGIPGKSNAFAIADRLGLPREIIDRAKAQLTSEENRLEEMIAALSADRRAAEEERKRAERLRKEAESLHAELKKKMEAWEETKGRLLESARREARSVVARAEREAEEVLRQLREWARRRPDQLKEHQLIEAKKRLEGAVPEMEIPARPAEGAGDPDRPLKPGDRVWVRTLNQKGEILEDLGGEEFQVQIGSLKMKVSRKDLAWIGSGKTEQGDFRRKTTSVPARFGGSPAGAGSAGKNGGGSRLRHRQIPGSGDLGRIPGGVPDSRERNRRPPDGGSAVFAKPSERQEIPAGRPRRRRFRRHRCRTSVTQMAARWTGNGSSAQDSRIARPAVFPDRSHLVFAQRHVTGELSRRLRESGNRRLRLCRARKSSVP